jgi:hypothetical protein
MQSMRTCRVYRYLQRDIIDKHLPIIFDGDSFIRRVTFAELFIYTVIHSSRHNCGYICYCFLISVKLIISGDWRMERDCKKRLVCIKEGSIQVETTVGYICCCCCISVELIISGEWRVESGEIARSGLFALKKDPFK